MTELKNIVTNRRNSQLVQEINSYLDTKMNLEGWEAQCMIDSALEAIKFLAQESNLL